MRFTSVEKPSCKLKAGARLYTPLFSPNLVHRILKYERKFGIYLFSFWEFGQPFIIRVEDGEHVAKFIESGEYRKYLLEKVTRCIVLFDIVGFSKLENQQQVTPRVTPQTTWLHLKRPLPSFKAALPLRKAGP